LGPQKSCRFSDVFQSKFILKFVWLDLAWPLLTAGRSSEMAKHRFDCIFGLLEPNTQIPFSDQKKGPSLFRPETKIIKGHDVPDYSVLYQFTVLGATQIKRDTFSVVCCFIKL
jgi:hypothetical protein